jgi:hypothetical protein
MSETETLPKEYRTTWGLTIHLNPLQKLFICPECKKCKEKDESLFVSCLEFGNDAERKKFCKITKGESAEF